MSGKHLIGCVYGGTPVFCDMPAYVALTGKLDLAVLLGDRISLAEVPAAQRAAPARWLAYDYRSLAAAIRWGAASRRTTARRREADRRNGRDSNPRALQPLAFKASAFVHSATVPAPEASHRPRRVSG